MNPELRFHSIVIGITTGLVFLIWLFFNRLIVVYPVTAVVLSGLISIGIYKAVAMLLLSLFRNIQIVKKFILGPEFMEGIWAGFFIGHKSNVRLVVETFEQDLNRTVIRGRVYDDNGNYRGSTIAEDATIDVIRAKLTYHYQADPIGTTFINQGIACFDLERSHPNKSPVSIVGFSSDLFNPQKLLAFEDKISDKKNLDKDELIEKAKEVYQKYKVHVSRLSQHEVGADH